MSRQCHGQRKSITLQLNLRLVRRIELCMKVCTDEHDYIRNLNVRVAPLLLLFYTFLLISLVSSSSFQKITKSVWHLLFMVVTQSPQKYLQSIGTW